MDFFFLMFFIPIVILVIGAIYWIVNNEEKSVGQKIWKLFFYVFIGVIASFVLFIGFAVLYYMRGGH